LQKGSLQKIIDFLNANDDAGIVSPKLLNLDNTIQNSCYRFPGLTDQFYKRFNIKNKRVDDYLMTDFSHDIKRFQ